MKTSSLFELEKGNSDSYISKLSTKDDFAKMKKAEMKRLVTTKKKEEEEGCNDFLARGFDWVGARTYMCCPLSCGPHSTTRTVVCLKCHH